MKTNMTLSPNNKAVVEVIENEKNPEKSKPLDWCSKQWRPILAELISTMLLVIFGCMACIPMEGFDPQPPMYAPFAFGFVILFNVQVFGHISGAHMNPAVTLAALIWNKITFPLAIAYVIVQCVGAILGYAILVGVSPMDLIGGGVCITLPYVKNNIFHTLGIEILLTSALSFLCCAFWDPKNVDKQESIAIKFGLSIAGLGLAGVPWTGASLNPARSLGPAVWTGVWTMHWVYWVGPLIGSAIAAVLYKYIWLNK